MSSFHIRTGLGLIVEFKRHHNGNWQAIAHARNFTHMGNSFELARSVKPADLPEVINLLVAQPRPDEDQFKKTCQDLRAKIRAAIKTKT